MAPGRSSMEHRNPTESNRLAQIVGSFLLFLLLFAWATPARADGSDPGRPLPEPDEPKTTAVAKVVSRPDGVYVEISVHEVIPGRQSPNAPARATPPPATTPHSTPVPSSKTPSTPVPAATPTSDRIWSDATGFYDQTPDGHLYYLTVPDVSSQTDWGSQFRDHPNQMPYTLYVDNKFQGIVWIPNNTNTSNVHFGPPPAQPSVPPNPPAGNGASTDPYQVALDLLDHVPLPNILIKTNPALGLVHLPGWFWVAGYDGKPFGTSRTVTIPPAVGPNVPFTEVPANDPRRQPTFFTVSVRVWPTSYQWSFGDGADLVTDSLGKAYPAESDIRHTYNYSSLHFKHGFPIQLTVVFDAQYQVNGGASRGLPPMAHDYMADYPVQEAQAILTGR